MSADLSQNSSALAGTRLLDVQQLAKLLNCSSRHCYRMADAGRLPAPLKLGSLVRWNLAEIEDWIAGGCMSVRMKRRGS